MPFDGHLNNSTALRSVAHVAPAIFRGRARTRDMLTYDQTRTWDGKGNHMGARFDRSYKTHDGRTVDSTGAFLLGELERLDPTLHLPLVEVSWSRDIDLREDVSIADDVTSYTVSTFASAGGLGTGNSIGNGKAWVGRNTTQITGVDVDINKIPHNLHPWAMELKYTIYELESAAKVGRPIDEQKFEALKLVHQMNIDEQVYYGDVPFGDTGLVNLSGVTPTNVLNGALGTPQWLTKTPDEILSDINTALTTTWANAAWAVVPGRIGIPPAQFGYIATAKVSLAGNMSILKYVMDNNVLTATGRGKLEIYPMKWCLGAGAGGTIGTTGTVDRMMVYTKNKKYVRFPMTLLQRTPLQYDGIWQKCSYFGRLGVVENPYPETVGFFDGI